MNFSLLNRFIIAKLRRKLLLKESFLFIKNTQDFINSQRGQKLHSNINAFIVLKIKL